MDDKVAAESAAEAGSEADAEQPAEGEDSGAGMIIVAGVPVAEGPAAVDEVTTANAVPADAADDGTANSEAAADPADVPAAGWRAKPRREASDNAAGAPSAEPRDADWSEASVR